MMIITVLKIKYNNDKINNINIDISNHNNNNNNNNNNNYNNNFINQFLKIHFNMSKKCSIYLKSSVLLQNIIIF